MRIERNMRAGGKVTRALATARLQINCIRRSHLHPSIHRDAARLQVFDGRHLFERNLLVAQVTEDAAREEKNYCEPKIACEVNSSMHCRANGVRCRLHHKQREDHRAGRHRHGKFSCGFAEQRAVARSASTASCRATLRQTRSCRTLCCLPLLLRLKFASPSLPRKSLCGSIRTYSAFFCDRIIPPVVVNHGRRCITAV